MTEEAVFKALKSAEDLIQDSMLRLEEKLAGSGWEISVVNVDTRNFANMKTEILVSKRSGKL